MITVSNQFADSWNSQYFHEFEYLEQKSEPITFISYDILEEFLEPEGRQEIDEKTVSEIMPCYHPLVIKLVSIEGRNVRSEKSKNDINQVE